MKRIKAWHWDRSNTEHTCWFVSWLLSTPPSSNVKSYWKRLGSRCHNTPDWKRLVCSQKSIQKALTQSVTTVHNWARCCRQKQQQNTEICFDLHTHIYIYTSIAYAYAQNCCHPARCIILSSVLCWQHASLLSQTTVCNLLCHQHCRWLHKWYKKVEPKWWKNRSSSAWQNNDVHSFAR